MKKKQKQAKRERRAFDVRLHSYANQAKLALSDTAWREKLGVACTMSAAAGAALSMSPAAEAGIRYSGVVNNTVERPNPATFLYPGPPQITYGAFGNFAITNTAGSEVGRFALAARIFNVYGYLGIAAFGSTPAIYYHCNSACGPTDPNFQALGRPRLSNGRMRPSPVPDGVSIGPSGAQFNEGTTGGGTSPVSLTFFDQLPTPGNDDRSLRKWSYGTEQTDFHLWEGSPGTLSAGEFAGIKLTIDGQPHFGWIRIAIANENHPPGTANARNGNPYQVTAIDWAYETIPNTPILAGDTGVSAGSADYDGDGDVDGNDFFEWQRGNSTNGLTPGDLELWQQQYGTNPLTAAVGAVPEPSTAAILSLGVLALGATGVRRHRNVNRDRQEQSL
ncbi:PEP-CTERM sorting domain-containing protein [Bythopirellula goksoeyrii]|uniref:Ice-binding protein C-terminal domain-containing protein n=1 Tax=Bythopirellula goksoeyrii TaxID=1400387 RepID=A0A5B9Q8M8_9BACT|nr:PEP-CTERM sorting domain-containing protein [Bythopirellula goksoeyrii]QEG33905.1 hypothetical protein Pr1d_11750 [Bythopirellula goksoeyrii]